MNKRKLKLKLKYFFLGLGVVFVACCFTFSFSRKKTIIEFNNVEALASEEGIDPTKYCKKAGGICLLNVHNIVIGLQIADKQ